MDTDNQLMIEARTLFDSIKRTRPDGTEYWSARDLQPLLGYEKWERFEDAVDRAKAACANGGYQSADHFPGAGKMVNLGSGSVREVPDYHLTRYASYLVAMNGDPRKPEIAAAQTYFAVQTHRQEQADANRFAVPQTLPEALRQYADALEQKALLEAKVQIMAPKAEFHDRVAMAKDGQSIGEAAKVLGTGQNRLFKWLRENGFLMGNNQPYQKYIDQGYFRVIEQTYPAKGEQHNTTKTLLTGKGLTWLEGLLRSQDEPMLFAVGKGKAGELK